MSEPAFYTPETLRAALLARGLDEASADHLMAVCPALLNDDIGNGLSLSELHPTIWSLVHQIVELCRWDHTYDLRLTLIDPTTDEAVASYTVENPDRLHTFVVTPQAVQQPKTPRGRPR